MKSLKEKLVYVVYIILCMIGLLYQVSLVCDEYFKYGVSSSTTLTQTNQYILPSLSTCFEFFEIFDYEKYNEMIITTKKSLTFKYFNDSALDIQANISVSDILTFTPDAEFICEFANIRNSSTFGFHELDGSVKCRDHFIIEKFLISSMMCYKWTLKGKPSIYNRESAYFTPHDHGDIIFVYFNQSLVPKFDCVTTVLHPSDNYPWTEFTLVQERSRGYNESTGKNILNFFRSKSNSISIHKLAPPYVTKCKNYKLNGYRDSYHCLSKCIEDGVEHAFGKASLSYHFFKPIDKLMLSYDDFTSENFNATYRPILELCHSACPPSDCDFITTYTSTTGEVYYDPGASVKLPGAPSFEIRYNVSVLFIDTINFTCSALGVWFGVSFMTINPLEMGKKGKAISKFFQAKIPKISTRMAKHDHLIPDIIAKLDSERQISNELRLVVMKNQRHIGALWRRMNSRDC